MIVVSAPGQTALGMDVEGERATPSTPKKKKNPLHLTGTACTLWCARTCLRGDVTPLTGEEKSKV